MLTARRFLPPLQWLAAFEAVARHGSVTAAAQELSLTQGAVSRQIQKLEEAAGTPLFHREKKRLHLTAQGETYAQAVRGGLARISNATMALHTGAGGGVLNLAILPAFGAHWLAPRLPAFLQENPGITVNLSTRPEPFDFAAEDQHGAIHFGQQPWPGSDGVKLWEEEVLAVAAPALVPDGPLTPVDVSRLPRLQLQSRPQGWPAWFAACGVPDPGGASMMADQFATLIQAACSGLGAALLPRYLIAEQLSSGALLAAQVPQPVISGAYFLVWPQGQGSHAALAALRRWLTAVRPGEDGAGAESF